MPACRTEIHNPVRLSLVLLTSYTVGILSVLALPAAAGASIHQQRQQQQLVAPPQQWQPLLLHYGSSVAPVLSNYSFSNAQDTFEMCRQQAGMAEGQEVPQDDLLQAFRLPKDLNKHKSLTLPQLIELLQFVQPEFKVVFEPMLSAETDIGRLVEPRLPSHTLPKLVHFTVKDKNKLQPHQVLAMASWAYYNPGYSLMLFDDDDISAFMASYYPDLLATFTGLGTPVERTDLWRYLVLCRLGGVYADSDVLAARPISQWSQDAGLLVGIENVFTTPEEARQRSYSRQVQMVQWSIAARPGHPVVCRMGEYVAKHVAEEQAGEFLDPDRDHAILERTGPGIWTDSVHDYLRQVANASIEQLVGGGRVGDVRVMPQPVFGCPTALFHAADALPYVYHMFMGSWKMQQPSGLTTFIRKLSSSLVHKQQLSGAEAPHIAAGQGSDLDTIHASKHPRRPILEEQIMQHQQQQQHSTAEHLALEGVSTHSSREQLMLTADSSAQAEQQQQQVAAAAQVALLHKLSSMRKLRSSQALLVRASLGPVSAGGGLLLEPEVPSQALSELPTLSLLVVFVLLITLYKRQRGSGTTAWAAVVEGSRTARLPPRSALTRPHSRAHVSLAGSSAPTASAGSLSPILAAGGVSVGAGLAGRANSLQEQEVVCVVGGQHASRGHGHKRSWGSTSSFQQL